MNATPLRKLASAAGIATDWTDALGNAHTVDDSALRALLRAMDLVAATDADSAHHLAALNVFRHSTLLPLYTSWLDCAFSLPAALLPPGTAYQVQLEGSGERVDGRLQHSADGGVTPERLPIGYHRLQAGGLETLLAVAPRRCYSVAEALAAAGQAPHLPWGVAAQIYSLRRAKDAGLGDYTALAELAVAAAAQGAAALAVSPTHAMFSAEPGRFSPYGPSSRLFFNVLHIDPTQVLGPEAMAMAMAVSTLPDNQHADAALAAAPMVDWPRAAGARLAVLRKLFEMFTHGADAALHQAFSRFCEAGGPDLQNHARFEALDGWLRMSSGATNERQETAGSSDWRLWPAELKDPQSAGVERFAAEHKPEVDFHLFLQWQASLGRGAAQTAARGAGMTLGLIADLAVGADPGGSQAWSLQSSMLAGVTVGAPPDLLAPLGQNWGLGALSPFALRRQGFAPWLAMLRANMQASGGIRIDHVLGLMRLWLVPQSEPSSNGAYLHFPLDDLLRLTALESMRHQAIVIGEDLGTVPEGFSDRLADCGVLGIRVLWFQREGGQFLAPRHWPANAMATTSTHDLPTVAGWWSGRDLAWRERLELFGPDVDAAARQQSERAADKQALQSALNTAGLPCDDGNHPPLDAALAFVGQTPAALVMVPLEDVLGIVEQPNLPGTVAVHPNWQQRLPDDASTLLAKPEVMARLAALAQARQHAPTPSHDGLRFESSP